MSPLKHTSLPSMVATFLTTCLMAVLQPSRYSVFHDGDTLIQLSLLWQSYSCQCLNTETSTRGNRSFTTETLSISYIISLYIRLVVTLYTSTQTFFPLSEVAIIWQTDNTTHKLKPRSFHKSAHLLVHSADFHSGVNCAWQYYQTPKFVITSEQFHLLNLLLQFHL